MTNNNFRFYAIYDKDLGGYKAGFASINEYDFLGTPMDKIVDLLAKDKEEADLYFRDLELRGMHVPFRIREVGFEDYLKIKNSKDYGLTTSVNLETELSDEEIIEELVDLGLIQRFSDTAHELTKLNREIRLMVHYLNGDEYDKTDEIHSYTVTYSAGHTEVYPTLSFEHLQSGYKKILGWKYRFDKIFDKFYVLDGNNHLRLLHASCKKMIEDVLSDGADIVNITEYDESY